MVYCKKCGSQLDKDSIYCSKCGTNQSLNGKRKRGRSKADTVIYSLLTVIAIGLIFIVVVYFKLPTKLVGVFGKVENRTPKEAAINPLRAIDNQDFESYVAATDYKGKYDNLKQFCKDQGIDYNDLKQLMIDEISVTDNLADQKFGNGWHKHVIVEEPNYSKSATEVDIKIKSADPADNGIYATVFKVPERGWYMKKESEEIYEMIEDTIEYLQSDEGRAYINMSAENDESYEDDFQFEENIQADISPEQAEQLARDLLVKSGLLALGDRDYIIECDGTVEALEGGSYYNIHVYMINVEQGHTATIGWIGVETNGESLYDFETNRKVSMKTLQ